MFMIWSRILKMTLIQQQSLHVRHALSGSGLEGDLRVPGNRDRQLSDTLTTIPLTRGLESYMPLFLHGEEIMKHTRLVVRLTGLGEAQAEGVVAVLALFLLVLGTALLAHWA
jgi:hypothetical protein